MYDLGLVFSRAQDAVSSPPGFSSILVRNPYINKPFIRWRWHPGRGTTPRYDVFDGPRCCLRPSSNRRVACFVSGAQGGRRWWGFAVWRIHRGPVFVVSDISSSWNLTYPLTYPKRGDICFRLFFSIFFCIFLHFFSFGWESNQAGRQGSKHQEN